MRKVLVAVGLTAVLAAIAAFATGLLVVVETYGNSMAPRITAGDLVLVRATTDYQVGDVVAYTSDELDRTVLHRIVAAEQDRYTLRGDHNDFDDPEHPTRSQLLGVELVHISGGGPWLDRLTHPLTLGLLAFALIAGGTTTPTRRARRNKPMAQHAAAPAYRRRTTPASLWPAAAGISAVVLVAGLILAALSWTRPVNAAADGDPSTQQVAFSYQAKVDPSPAYDDTQVTDPDPVFRNLTDTVEVRYAYRGEPGTITVAAELATDSGWHTTVPLRPATGFAGQRHSGRVVLDLDALDHRAQAAAEAIGIPATQVDVSVLATVETADGGSFPAALPFTMTPLQLTLVGGPPALTVENTSAGDRAPGTWGTVDLVGRAIPVSVGRVTGASLALVGVLGLAASLLVLRRPGNDPAAIAHRHAELLLQVEPMTPPAGRPVVDVAEFPALATLAERYGLLIMHWTRSNVHTYVVHDDGVTYRHRIGHNPVPRPAEATTRTTELARERQS